MKILIIGHARHGKDTVAEMLQEEYSLSFDSSSKAAAKIFLYDKLKGKYGYNSFEECFLDRMNHRAEWYEAIKEYNKDDRTKLAKDILLNTDIYVGMRDFEEIKSCKEQGIFDLIIGVWNPTKPEEPKDSFNIDLWQSADIIIPNAGTLNDLRTKILTLHHLFIPTECI